MPCFTRNFCKKSRYRAGVYVELWNNSETITSGVNQLAGITFGNVHGQSYEDNSLSEINFNYLSLGRKVNDNAIQLNGIGEGNSAIIFVDGAKSNFVVETDDEGLIKGGTSIQEKSDGSVADGATSLLDQDDGDNFTALITHANGASSDISQLDIDEHLTLIGTNGDPSKAIVQLLRENNESPKHFADAYYTLETVEDTNSHLTFRNGDIGVLSNLEQLDIVDGETVTFDDTTGTESNDFKALITEKSNKKGGGSIAIAPVSISKDGNTQTNVVLTNEENRFSGATTIKAGAQLTLGNNGVLGSDQKNKFGLTGFTSNVIFEESSKLDLNGYSQTVGAVSLQRNFEINEQDLPRDAVGQIDFGSENEEGKGGQLTIVGLSDSAVGSIVGQGKLLLESSDLYIDRADQGEPEAEVDFEIGANSSDDDPGARLIAGSVDALGSGKVSLSEAEDRLVLAFDESETADDVPFDNLVKGEGGMEFWGQTNYIVSDASDPSTTHVNTFSGGVFVKTKANVQMGDAVHEGKNYAGTGDFHVEKDGTLTIHTQDGWTLANGQLVYGDGTFAVVKHGDQQSSFLFADDQNGEEPVTEKNGFTGRLDLTNIRIGFKDVDGVDESSNKSVLDDAVLVLNSNSTGDFNTEGITFVGLETTGNHVVLDFSDYENYWAVEDDNELRSATNHITADYFKFNNAEQSEVRVDLANIENVVSDKESAVDQISTKPLLDQDNGDIIYYLGLLTNEDENGIQGDLANFELKLKNDKGEFEAPKNPYAAFIAQNSDDVATGYYNLGLGKDSKGFGISFGLREIWIYDQKTLLLSEGEDNTLSARLTEHANDASSEITPDHPEGIGSIEILDKQKIRLSNSYNDLTGKATIGKDASLIVAVSNALGGGTNEDASETYGYVSNVSTESGSLMLGESPESKVEQKIGTIHVGENGKLILNGSSVLTIAGGFADATEEGVGEEGRELANNIIEGHIQGGEEAGLIVSGGTHLSVNTADNVNYQTSSFKTTVEENSVLRLANSLSLGTGLIVLNATEESEIVSDSNSNGRLEITADRGDWQMENELAGAGDVFFIGRPETSEGESPEQDQHALYLKLSEDQSDESKQIFTGTLHVDDGLFSMHGTVTTDVDEAKAHINASEMAQASLELTENSILTLSGGKSLLANLTLSDSTISAGSVVSSSDGYFSSGWIDMTESEDAAGELTIEGSNKLELTGLGNINDFALLAQDDGVVVTIVKAKAPVNVVGNGSVTWDSNNDEVQQEIQENVIGTYGVGGEDGTSGNAFFENDGEHGLFVNAKLLEVDIRTADTLLGLEPVTDDAAPGSPDASFSASIVGEGNIFITGDVTLDHKADERFVTTFTGETKVRRNATLRLATEGSLGTIDSHTSVVHLLEGATLEVQADTNQYLGGIYTYNSDTAAKIDIAEDATLFLMGNEKELSTKIVDTGALTGTGDLVIAEGTHLIASANESYGKDGSTTVSIGTYSEIDPDTDEPSVHENEATLEIADDESLGGADISLGSKGTLAFVCDSSAGGSIDVFDNKLSGTGDVVAREGVVATIDGDAGVKFEGTYVAEAGGKLILQGAEEFGEATGWVEENGTLRLYVEAKDDSETGAVKDYDPKDPENGGSWTLNNAVAGEGTFAVDLGYPSEGNTLGDVNNQLNFDNDVAEAMAQGFTGTLALTNGRLRIQDVESAQHALNGNYAETALANAMLEIGNGARVMVSENDFVSGNYHKIGGLSFADYGNGTLRLGEDEVITLGESTDEQTPLLHVETLDASGSATIEINVDDESFAGINVSAEGTQEKYSSLLDQDDGDLYAQLVRATGTAITGQGGNLDINFVLDGHELSEEQKNEFGTESLASIHLYDREEGADAPVVAIGHYGYGASVETEYEEGGKSLNGLWLSYGLTQVDIQNGQTLVLAESNSERSGAKDFKAQITETQFAFDENGDLVYDEETNTAVIKEDATPEESVGNVEVRGHISLSNQENAYHGVTTVTANSSVTAANSNVLGQEADNQHTSALILQSAAGFNLNGFSQTIGALNAGSGAWIKLDADTGNTKANVGDNAKLVIENGGFTSTPNALRGHGTLVLESGILAVNGANSSLSGTVMIGAQPEDSEVVGGGAVGNAGANAVETLADGTENEGADGTEETEEVTAVAVITHADGFGSSDIQFADEGSLLYMKDLTRENATVVFDNKLIGNGTVRADSSEVLVTGDNTGFTGTWEIGFGDRYELTQEKGEGSAGASTMRFESFEALGGTADDGYADFVIGAGSTLELGIQSSYTLEHKTSGEGGVTIDAGSNEDGLNVVTLTSNFAHTGLTHVVSGGIRSAGDTFTSDDVIEDGTSDVDDAEGSESADSGEDAESGAQDAASKADSQIETNAEPSSGSEAGIDAGDVDSTTLRTTLPGDVTLEKGTFMDGFAGVKGTVRNSGTIYVNWKRYADTAAAFEAEANQSSRAGEESSIVYGTTDQPNQLVIEGDYVGEGGTLVFNGALASDDCPIDTILIEGDASGTGKVVVHNLGGQGAYTTDHGITLVEIEGDATLELTQENRIVAGAYEYKLFYDDVEKRFFLHSREGEYPFDSDVPAGPLIRPEAGAYMAASASADWLEMRLHDRAGESHYVDPLSGEVKETSMWMRQTATHEHFRAYKGDLHTHMTGGVTQIGGDIIRYNEAGDVRGNLGLFGSVLYGESSTRSVLTGHTADTKSDGYSVGIYGTLFSGQGEELDRGGYIDVWAQWAMLNHEIRPEQLEDEKVDADGLIASVEAGWTFQLGTTEKGTSHEVNWSLQPQAQVIYEGAQLDDHVESGGTRVHMKNDYNIKTRLGFRLQASPAVKDGEKRGQGFLEFNWIRNSDPLGVVMNGTTIDVDGTKHAGEIRFGFEKELTDSLHGWINGGYLAGGSGYHQETINVGLKYLW